jgi:hypothetical protein
MVTLNRAVATAMAAGPVTGPAAGLALLDGLAGPLAGHYRLDAVRAHLLEMAGDQAGAVAHYRAAAARTTNTAEQQYLTLQAARLQSARVSGTPGQFGGHGAARDAGRRPAGTHPPGGGPGQGRTGGGGDG